MDTKPFGIMSCITPCGMLYSTARGGQIQGRELLSMQGLPMDRLSLTRESQSQMQDLAGNAMSTTVVGPAMISALIICHSVLKAESEEQVMETEDNIEESMPTVALTSSYLKSMRTVTSSSFITATATSDPPLSNDVRPVLHKHRYRHWKDMETVSRDCHTCLSRYSHVQVYQAKTHLDSCI